MTAEVAILNRHAIALAADSAVTLGSGKVFNSVNKLFSLSKYHPVGIMIYGDASFSEVPWETIIKAYRQVLGKKRVDTLAAYAYDFLEYLENEASYRNANVEDSYFGEMAIAAFTRLKLLFDDLVKEKEITGTRFTGEEALAAAKRIFQSELHRMKAWESRHSDSNAYAHELSRRFSSQIPALIQRVFGTLPLEEEHTHILAAIAITAIVRNDPSRRHRSGLVISGFGEKDIFPGYIHCTVAGIFERRLKYQVHHVGHVQIVIDEDTHDGIIAPFARECMGVHGRN